MDRESVAQGMGSNRLADAGDSPSLLAGELDGTSVDRLATHIALEQPTLRPHDPKVATKRFQQLRREHHVTILLSFALLDLDDHSLTIDVGRLEMDSFGDAQAGGVAGSQNRPVFGAGHAAQKVEDLLR